MLKKVLWGLLGLVVVAGCAVGFLAWKANRPVQAPLVQVVADTSPEGVARGRMLFANTCQNCHAPDGAARATGTHMEDVPSFLGTFHSANITRHPTAGIGDMSDAELGRMVRYGVGRRSRPTIMPTYGFGDADLAALLGYLRSGDPLFEPDPTVRPLSELTFVGTLIMGSIYSVPARPPQGLAQPPRRPDAAYGAYLAREVLDCVGCHSPGFDPSKADDPEVAFTGGFEFTGASGQPVHSVNLTPHATGLGGWTLADFDRVLREGLRRDGTSVRYPMPSFRTLGDVEVAALFTYLQTLPAQRGEHAPSAPAPRLAERERPEHLFSRLCADCHAPGARDHVRLKQAAGKSAEEVAQWIRHPEATKPGTRMPTFASRVDEADALALARYVLATYAGTAPTGAAGAAGQP